MQRCAICEKPIYGHPDSKGKPVVCGSCPLQKMPGVSSGKGIHEIRQSMAKIAKEKIPDIQESYMKEIKIRSNSRNKTVLLDGRHPITFDEHGMANMPAHLMEILEREMTVYPGRFRVVEEQAVEAPAPVLVPLEIEPLVAKSTVSEAEVPKSVDLSYLTDEKKSAPVKAAKKK